MRIHGACVIASVFFGFVAGAQPPAAGAESFGSLRNARVAVADASTAPLVYLTGPMNPELLTAAQAAAPNVRFITGLSRESALEHADAAYGADARLVSPELIEKAPHLAWVHASSAGVDRYVSMEKLVSSERIVLTNSRAVHGPAIADHAFAMLLSLTRNLGDYGTAQREKRWADGRGEHDQPSIALDGKTMLVVGIGGIGEEMAKRAHGFGMRVIATRRSDAPAPAFVEKIGKPVDLIAMLPEADVVAICVPLTAETAGMFGLEAFAAMKPGAYLVNIARGKIVDTDALIDALASGRLAGACLDVTDPEPLPAGHRLWSMPRVVITPHVAADAPITDERGRSLFIENVRRFGAGEPLLNVVDVRAGY